MAPAVPRLRVFGGPNGSGKSTIKEALKPEWLGVYVNADDLEKDIRRSGHAELTEFGLSGSDLADIHTFLSNSTLLAREPELLTEMASLTVEDTRVDFGMVKVNSYHASVLCDFIRHRLLAHGISFTFETVMSSPDKVDFMALARAHGFRTYLYFVATDDPEINVERVNNRVRRGSHPVPPEKIRERYYRSLQLLPQAIDQSSRAYVFDNSGTDHLLLAEISDYGESLRLEEAAIQPWFEPVLHRYL
jgi:predicted ABC-type ATPase